MKNLLLVVSVLSLFMVVNSFAQTPGEPNGQKINPADPDSKPDTTLLKEPIRHEGREHGQRGKFQKSKRKTKKIETLDESKNPAPQKDLD